MLSLNDSFLYLLIFEPLVSVHRFWSVSSRMRGDCQVNVPERSWRERYSMRIAWEGGGESSKSM